jgi:hypothetical protein
MFIVYIIRNTINNKNYIGYTGRKLEARFKSHLTVARNIPKFRFHFAINFHKPENFFIEKLEDNIENESLAKEKEIYWIKMYKSDNPKLGYNATSGGTGGWMIPRMTLERQELWRQKIIETSTGENNPRYSGIDNENFINLLYSKCIELGKILSFGKLSQLIIDDGIVNFPKSLSKYRGNKDYIYSKLVDMTGLKIEKNKKTEDHIKKLSLSIMGKIFINNGIKNIAVNKSQLNEYLNKGYIKGRINVKNRIS